MQTTSLKNTQNNYYSIEVLRILAMWMFVALHFLGIGGVLEKTNSIYYYVLVSFWKFCSVCINLYILTSCYFLVGKKFRISRLLYLYLETIFYCIIFYFYAIFTGAETFSIQFFLFQILCPFTSKQYWLLTGYLMVYLLSPILNFLVKKMSRHQLLMTCLSLLLMFSFWVDIYPYLDINIFNFSNGYSFHWFIVLFFFAAYLRLYINVEKWKVPVLWYVGISIVMSFIAIIMPTITGKLNFLNPWAEHFTRYNSVLTTISSVFLFVAFMKWTIKSKSVKKIISIMIPLNLGVYLIHENTYARSLIWHTLLHTERFPDSIIALPLMILIVSLLFLGCMMLDSIRELFFVCLKKSRTCRFVMDKIDSLVYKPFKKLSEFLKVKI